MKVWVVLPAYNEAENLGALLNNFNRMRQDVYNLDLKILLINDGSTDKTAQIARDLGNTVPVEVFDNPQNMGLAYTFKRGIQLAAEKASQEDVIVCMDADNSHNPGLCARMIRDIQEGRDVVIASRYQPGAVVRGVPLLRRFMSYGMSILFRIVFPIPGVKDYSCGYRAYRAGFLQDSLKRKGSRLFVGEGFSCMAGILLSLGREGAVCGEVPIILRYDQKAGASKMKVMTTVSRTLKMLFCERFRFRS